MALIPVGRPKGQFGHRESHARRKGRLLGQLGYNDASVEPESRGGLRRKSGLQQEIAGYGSSYRYPSITGRRGSDHHAASHAARRPSSSSMLTAASEASSCSGRLAPTIAEVTPGCAITHATATDASVDAALRRAAAAPRRHRTAHRASSGADSAARVPSVNACPRAARRPCGTCR